MKKKKIQICDLEKKSTFDKNIKKKYATFLKRKRIENNMTLEELASGVCAVSYLSRIENNLVDVSEEYYVQLFKKLKINFYELKEEKEQEIFKLILKNYLQKDEDKIVMIINEALKKNYYTEIEYELMLLFDNIIKKLYADAKKQLLDINSKIEVLLDHELIFYLFLTSLYSYRTYQCNFAYRQILVLCEMTQIDELYKYAIYDLALDICDYLGAKEMFYKYYQEINNEEYLTYYSHSALKHKAQLVYLIYSLKSDETYDLLQEIKMNIDSKYWEEIDWIILRNEYRFSNFHRCFEILNNIDLTPRLIAFEALLVIMSEEHSNFVTLKLHREKIIFDEKESHYEMLYNLCMLIKTSEYNVDAYALIKEIVLLQYQTTVEDFFFNIERILLMELAVKYAKYKECIKIILNFERGKHKLPYIL